MGWNAPLCYGRSVAYFAVMPIDVATCTLMWLLSEFVGLITLLVTVLAFGLLAIVAAAALWQLF